jgi:hypothetical protein
LIQEFQSIKRERRFHAMSYGFSSGMSRDKFTAQYQIQHIWGKNGKAKRVMGYHLIKREGNILIGKFRSYESAKTELEQLTIKAIEDEAKSRKRAKHVFPSAELPHLWAHRVQDSARNAHGNLFFRGDTIYSYGEHFPIARHVTNSKGKRAVLFNSASYSSTTSSHQGAVRSAIPSTGKDALPIFEVPALGINSYSSLPSEITASTHKANITHYLEQSKSEMDKTLRSRGRGEYNLSTAIELQDSCKLYCKFFSIKSPSFPFIPSGKKLSALQSDLSAKKRKADARQKELWETRDERARARDAARAKERAEREAKELAELPEKIARWRNGESIHFSYSYGSIGSGLIPCMLRIKGDEVETSLGAHVPLDHAKRGLTLVRAVMSSNRPYERNGHTVHLGHYAIDKIETNGTLKAGCHVISWPEIAIIADSLDGKVDQSELILSDIAQA